MEQEKARSGGASLYEEVTARIISELEEGRLPWVQPWDEAACGCGMLQNAATARLCSGINILSLWTAVIDGGYHSQRWLTFRQALALDGAVRRGEKGTTVCFADLFTPKHEQERAHDEQREARQVAFLKRFTVFNIDQCKGLPESFTTESATARERETIDDAEALITGTGADFRIGGSSAFYSPSADFVQVPPQQVYPEQVNWCRTALHELGHWTGHSSRLERDLSGQFRSSAYASEELVAEMASAFVCASLSIQPTVRHADYIGAWLDVLRKDERAVFRAASLATKAADYLLRSRPEAEVQS